MPEFFFSPFCPPCSCESLSLFTLLAWKPEAMRVSMTSNPVEAAARELLACLVAVSSYFPIASSLLKSAAHAAAGRFGEAPWRDIVPSYRKPPRHRHSILSARYFEITSSLAPRFLALLRSEFLRMGREGALGNEGKLSRLGDTGRSLHVWVNRVFILE